MKTNYDYIKAEFDCIRGDEFSENERLLAVKPKLDKLEESEKICLMLYAEYASYRKAAELLGCSHTYLEKVIAKIRKKLW